MDYLLTEEQIMLRDVAKQIAEEVIRPVAAEYDEKEEFPWDVMKVIADSDLFGVFIEEKYGGTGGGVLEMAIATEELSSACGGIAVCFAASALGSFPIILFGNEEQKKRFLPDLASGKKLAAFALTEAEAGSDASNIQTTARKDGDSYILNGTKQWITNGGEAQIYTVIATTMMNIQRNKIGLKLAEIDLGQSCFPYEYFDAERFAIATETPVLKEAELETA